MSTPNLSGHGAEIKLVTGIAPAANAAGTVTGANGTTGVDRLGANFAVVEVQTGAVTGAPTTQTLDVKIQHSDAIGSGFVDYVPGAVGSGAVAQLTAVQTRKRKTIDLRGAKRYVRLSSTTAFTGGTSPTLFSVSTLILGGFDVLPAQLDD